MTFLHSHHHHDHHHGRDRSFRLESAAATARRRLARFMIAALVLGVAVAAACLVMVNAGQAIVITRFGDPVRVVTHPGLAWRLPAPIEDTVNVDLRLHTTLSGLQDIGTRDGLRVLVQAYVAWQVPDDAPHITQFLRAVRNEPDTAAQQLRSMLGSVLETTAGSFDLANLVNTDPRQVALDRFEQQVEERISSDVLRVYGIKVRQVGIERLTLSGETLAATVARMKADRETLSAERTAEGQRIAAEIRSNAERDARVTVAKAKADAAEIEAQSRREAAEIYAKAFAENPDLYTLLRSLDTLDSIVGSNVRVILRTDAAPFRMLVDGPSGAESRVASPSGPPASHEGH
jgi:modulator of FtsH protease HflC